MSTVNLASPSIALQPPTKAILTSCAEYSDGVTCVTGHADGLIVFWGVLYPSDVSKEGVLRKKPLPDKSLTGKVIFDMKLHFFLSLII